MWAPIDGKQKGSDHFQNFLWVPHQLCCLQECSPDVRTTISKNCGTAGEVRIQSKRDKQMRNTQRRHQICLFLDLRTGHEPDLQHCNRSNIEWRLPAGLTSIETHFVSCCHLKGQRQHAFLSAHLFHIFQKETCSSINTYPVLKPKVARYLVFKSVKKQVAREAYGDTSP